MTFKAGEPVHITYNGQSVEGEILMASASGLSLTLTFNEYLGGYMRLMPVLWLDDQYVDLLLAEPVHIRPRCTALPWPQQPARWHVN
jgi:hypothetical protein